MNIYELTVPQFVRVLTQVNHWLDKAHAYAQQKKFNPQVYLSLRLAPDQLPFSRQIQIISDHTKNGTARLAGVVAPKFEDNEATFDELRTRVAKTIDYLNTLTPELFQGAAERKIPFASGKYLPGAEFLITYNLPTVYFHATTAYSILRHNGVELGKQDYLGPLAYRDA